MYPKTALTAFSLAIALAVAGCAGPTPYQPEDQGQGYAERQLEPDRYRVSFTGNSVTPRQRVEDYLMFRAAEITLARGRDYFVVANRETEPLYEDYRGPAPGWGGYIGSGYGSGGGSFTTTGLTYGTGGAPERQYRAYADIVLYSGPKPQNDPQAYDARAVRSHLASRIERPGG